MAQRPEARLWQQVRNAIITRGNYLGLSPMVLWRNEDRFRKGVPDVVLGLRDIVWQLELKQVRAPARATTLIAHNVTAYQLNHLCEWQGPMTATGGFYRHAAVLLRADTHWFLLPPHRLVAEERLAYGQLLQLAMTHSRDLNLLAPALYEIGRRRVKNTEPWCAPRPG